MNASKTIIIIGSKTDLKYAETIKEHLIKFDIDVVIRVSSAHKTPLKCYEIIKKYEKDNVVFIAVVGRSNALCGFIDAQTHCPVITSPIYSEKFGGGDIYSSLRMPSGVVPLVILEPENTALAVAKIFAINNEKIQQKVKEYQENMRKLVEEADIELNK